MRSPAFLFLAPAILLAACDSQQQGQQARDGNSEGRSGGQQVATTPNPPASTPDRPAGQGAAPGNAAPGNAAPGTTSTETTATIPPTSGPTPRSSNLPASAPGIGAAPLQGRIFEAANGTLRFGDDRAFTWTDSAGKTLTGRFVQEAERIAFNDVQGQGAGASIPMACRYRMDGPNRIVIEDSGTTCPVFRGMTFEAQPGGG